MDNTTLWVMIFVLVTLDVRNAAFIVHSKNWTVERSCVSLQRRKRTAGIMNMKPEFVGTSNNNTQDGTDDFIYSSQYDCLLRDGLLQYTGDQEKENLRIAFGAGKGKHASKRRRRHTNKYSSKSKAAKDDPWEQQLRLAEETSGEDKARERLEIEEREARRFQRRIERGDVIYPDEEDIDPYDPSSFGYIEVGHILGAHGVKGEVKVRSSTDFAVNRLCTPGAKHIKSPNRRVPRDIELICGRLQKEDIFLLQLEGVSTREAAAALRGHKVYVLETEEVKLDSDEYMVRDIVGARAYRADDESVYLGEVVGAVLGNDIYGGLASDMLELRLPSERPTDVPKFCYIPFVSAFVPAVRLNAGSNPCVLLDLPEGMLDLAVEVEDKVTIKGLLPG